MLGFVLATGYAAVILFAIRELAFFRAPGLSPRVVSAAFLLKVLAGTGLWYIYTYVHVDRATADLYRYFDDGNIMFSALPDHPADYVRMLSGIGNDQPHFDTRYYLVMNNWYRQYESNMYNDAHTMIRLNAFLRLFSFGHIHVHTVFACFLSTIGLVALYRAFVVRMKGHERWLLGALFLLPSVLFWASGVIKESLLMFGLGTFIYTLLEMQRSGVRPWMVVVLPFSAVLLFFLKFYVLLSMVPALIAYLWCRGTGGRRPWFKFAATYAVFIIAGLNSELVYPGFDILEVLWVKQRDFIGLATEVEAGSFVPTTLLEPTLSSFLSQVPHALYMTFVSPFTTWNNGPLGAMSAAENLLLLLILAAAIRWRRRWSEVDVPLLLFCIGFTLVLALVIGWTTPVIGALVRYRVPFLPFLVMACLCIADPARLPLRWKQQKP